MRYYQDSRRVTIKYFGNLYLHEEMHFVVSDIRNTILTSLYNISEVVN